MPSSEPISLPIPADCLKPFIRETVLAILAEREAVQVKLPPGRLAWTEPELAPLLGLARHQLRDERLKGRIGHSRGPGGRVLYSRADAEAYLLRGREEKEDAR